MLAALLDVPPGLGVLRLLDGRVGHAAGRPRGLGATTPSPHSFRRTGYPTSWDDLHARQVTRPVRKNAILGDRLHLPEHAEDDPVHQEAVERGKTGVEVEGEALVSRGNQVRPYLRREQVEILKDGLAPLQVE